MLASDDRYSFKDASLSDHCRAEVAELREQCFSQRWITNKGCLSDRRRHKFVRIGWELHRRAPKPCRSKPPG